MRIRLHHQAEYFGMYFVGLEVSHTPGFQMAYLLICNIYISSQSEIQDDGCQTVASNQKSNFMLVQIKCRKWLEMGRKTARELINSITITIQPRPRYFKDISVGWRPGSTSSNSRPQDDAVTTTDMAKQDRGDNGGPAMVTLKWIQYRTALKHAVHCAVRSRTASRGTST